MGGIEDSAGGRVSRRDDGPQHSEDVPYVKGDDRDADKSLAEVAHNRINHKLETLSKVIDALIYDIEPALQPEMTEQSDPSSGQTTNESLQQPSPLVASLNRTAQTVELMITRVNSVRKRIEL